MYYIKLLDRDIVGSLLEWLICVYDRYLEIYLIVGMRRRGVGKKEDECLKKELMNDEKEKVEYYMFVDLVCNDIGRVVEYGFVIVFEFIKVVFFLYVMYIIFVVIGCLK